MEHEMRYSELLKSLSGCTKRMLSLQLSQLENDQIIQKEVDTGYVPIKTSYYLTEIGQSLIPNYFRNGFLGERYLKNLNQLS